jgi:pantoate kinase
MQVLLNRTAKSIPPVEYVIQKLAPEPINVSFETPLPLGYGFGLSAACCLSVAFAIAKHFHLDLSRTELGMLAHEAEVAYRTGLGDVSSQLCGGVVYRQCKQGPLDSQRLAIKPQPIYFRVFDELETAGTLNDADIMQALAKEGNKANQWLLDNMNRLTLDNLLACARTFAEETKLLTNEAVRNCVQAVLAAGGQATMIMLGQGVLSTMPVGDPGQWIQSEIAEEGTRYLDNGHSH